MKKKKKKKDMATTKQKQAAQSGKEKDQETLDRMVARALARRFPLYEAGRNTVGFLGGMVGNIITDRITDLLRGHTREMQGAIAFADAIRVKKANVLPPSVSMVRPMASYPFVTER